MVLVITFPPHKHDDVPYKAAFCYLINRLFLFRYLYGAHFLNEINIKYNGRKRIMRA